MTKDELKALIRETSGPIVAEAVAEFKSKHVDPLATAQSGVTAFMQGAGLRAAGGDGAAAVPFGDKGLSFARCVRATAAAKLRGTGTEGAIQILRSWGNEDLAEKWSEARTKALAAGDATAGGFLVPTQFSAEVIEFLRAQSVVRRLQARVISVPTGTLKVPKLTGGATAYYIGENTNATKSEPAAGQLTLSFKKLVTLVPMSNDLLRYSSPGADAIVRDDVVNAMRVREDQAFIRDAGTESTPKGLRYWAHADNIIAATGSVSLQNVFTDLGRLIQKLLDANMPMIAPAWIIAPRTYMFLLTLLNTNGMPVFREELNAGKLFGAPYAITTNVPTNLDVSGTGANDESEIYFVDMAQALIGESMNLLVDASQEAAYHDGSSVVAAYSQDQTVVRAIAEHDFGMRHDKAIAVLTQVDWAPGSV